MKRYVVSKESTSERINSYKETVTVDLPVDVEVIKDKNDNYTAKLSCKAAYSDMKFRDGDDYEMVADELLYNAIGPDYTEESLEVVTKSLIYSVEQIG